MSCMLLEHSHSEDASLLQLEIIKVFWLLFFFFSPSECTAIFSKFIKWFFKKEFFKFFVAIWLVQYLLRLKVETLQRKWFLKTIISMCMLRLVVKQEIVQCSPDAILEIDHDPLWQAARSQGVDCLVAPYEADAQLAYLNKAGIVQAIITEDSDLLAFGCKKVLYYYILFSVQLAMV